MTLPAVGGVLLEQFFSREFVQGLLLHALPALFPFLLAAAATIGLVPIAILVAPRLGLMKEPGDRHIHLRPTPEIGGLAIYLAFAVAVVAYVPISRPVVGMLGVGGAAALVLMIDDRFKLPARAKILIQAGLALLAMFGFGYLISGITLPVVGLVQLGLLAVPLTLFWLLSMQNTVNILDGVDGLAAGVVGIVAVVLAIAAASRSHEEAVLLAAALAGCCFGFLVFNFNPARIFMGDSGSHFLGITVGMLTIFGVAKGVVLFALVLPVLALAIPIADTAWAIIRRRRQGVSIAHRDTRHIHYQLLDFGLSQRQTCLVMYSGTAILGSLGLMLFGHRRILTVAIVVLVVAVSTAIGEQIERANWRVPAPGLKRLLGSE